MVFEQLKTLESSCSVAVESFVDRDRKLKWRVTIKPHTPPPDSIVTEAEDKTEAVRNAVGRAAVCGLLSRSVHPR